MDKKNVRECILEHALKLAPFEGWTRDMLRHATKDAGLSQAELVRTFDEDPLQVISFWADSLDLELRQYAKTLALVEMKIRERIYYLVMHRLEVLLPNREALRRARTLLILPWNAPFNMQLMSRSIDTIWRLAGDTSNDYNWYSKRLLLAGVYTATILYWFQDESAGLEDTQRFLKARIENVLKIGGAIGKILNKAA